jgi:hypothetical protein
MALYDRRNYREHIPNATYTLWEEGSAKLVEP